MNYKSGVTCRFLALAALLVAARTASACVCPDRDSTVLGKFEEAQFVVIAKALSVEKEPEALDIRAPEMKEVVTVEGLFCRRTGSP